MNNSGLNCFWSNQIIDLLYKKGVRYACISPGSRNTPLVNAFANHSKIECFSHIDERSSAFFALGLTKKSLKPVVVLTTSGTATANLFPAIIEGSLSMKPLIIITADRPENLVNTGENQTINQANIYGDYVRKMENLNKNKSVRILKKIDSLVNISLGEKNIPGPVHLNIRFEEPLLDNNKLKITYKPKSIKINNKNRSFSITKFKRPVIVCGELSSSKPVDIVELSNKLKCPILADSLSNLRHYKNKNILAYYDHYIDNLDKMPDCIIRFGKKPVSKKLTTLMKKCKKSSFLVDPYLSFNDDCPNVIKSSLNNTNFIFENNIDYKWIEKILKLEEYTKKLVGKMKFNNKSEITLVETIANKLNNNDILFIGNSMPIRIFDQFSGKLKNNIKLFSNRGASGIDGIISTSLGISHLNKNSKNFLLIGDVSLFHDSNAFHILKNTNINLTIIVVNNKGGQIFSRLSYSNNNIKDFEKFWITPPLTKIDDLANLFKIKYYNLDIKGVNSRLDKISNLKGVKLIEVIINSKTDIKISEKLNQKISLI